MILNFWCFLCLTFSKLIFILQRHHSTKFSLAGPEAELLSKFADEPEVQLAIGVFCDSLNRP